MSGDSRKTRTVYQQPADLFGKSCPLTQHDMGWAGLGWAGLRAKFIQFLFILFLWVQGLGEGIVGVWGLGFRALNPKPYTLSKGQLPKFSARDGQRLSTICLANSGTWCCSSGGFGVSGLGSCSQLVVRVNGVQECCQNLDTDTKPTLDPRQSVLRLGIRAVGAHAPIRSLPSPAAIHPNR